MKSTLHNLINGKCPELLELKLGCEVLSTNFGTKYKIIGKCYGGYNVTQGGGLSMLNDYQFENGSVEILGTPPSWSDYLRCLGDDYAIDGGGNIWKYVKEYKAWLSHSFEDATEFPVVDLTKSVLEQSDEILQKLVDLISKE